MNKLVLGCLIFCCASCASRRGNFEVYNSSRDRISNGETVKDAVRYKDADLSDTIDVDKYKVFKTHDLVVYYEKKIGDDKIDAHLKLLKSSGFSETDSVKLNKRVKGVDFYLFQNDQQSN